MSKTTQIVVAVGVVAVVGGVAYMVSMRGDQRSFPRSEAQPVRGQPAGSAVGLATEIAKFGGALVSLFKGPPPPTSASIGMPQYSFGDV